ncbi:MAG: class F420-dependent enzyme [Pseudonocardiales bacterium]|nr:class F420-dependent enzyme [Pseudonocardiales bacterium]
MTATLSSDARALFDSPEYATIATIEPNGQPQLSVVWVGRDGDDILISTIVGTRKHRNLQRDPRATVLLSPKDAPWIYVEVRGTVTMTTEGGRELIEAFSRRYTEDERYSYDDGTDNIRVVVRIEPVKVIEYAGA